jgi:hypothetical protein
VLIKYLHLIFTVNSNQQLHFKGDLSAHCVGQNKVAYCELLDQMDGTFSLFIKPQEPGKHTLTIKYGGDNVPGKRSWLD